MKRIYLLFLCFFLAVLSYAVPAYQGLFTVKQPDSTTVTLRQHGDEYLHFTTTADGYSVVRNAQGYYVYARKQDGALVPTQQVAHDAEMRGVQELQFLAATAKRIAPDMSPWVRQEREAELSRQAQARAAVARREPLYDYNNFRGLVVLIEFNDCQFSRSDYKDIMTDMFNVEGYTGFMGTNGRKETYTGSVRDYFVDQSSGQFKPTFDIFGPYQVDFSQYDAATNSRNGKTLDILKAALTLADADVDFSQYDGNNDGMVDMVYFIVAGYGSHMGNDSRLWWPHRSVVYDRAYGYYVEPIYKDGVAVYDYASSVEMYGYTAYPQSAKIDGIGTICHEFGHVLGLPDLYDTDYEQSGGESHHPGNWSIMSGGSYFNVSRTPVGYSLYERYAVGFTTPQLISSVGSYTLQNLDRTQQGYRINSPVNNEYFLFENRQKDSKWNAYLPGHGMLVHRVDSTNSNIWQRNEVNANPKHNYYELIRANGVKNTLTGDPFPGTSQVTTLTNETSPANLKSWAGRECRFGLDHIREADGLISFEVIDLNVLRSVELPAELFMNVGISSQLEPVRTPASAPYTLSWSSDNEAVATVSQQGVVMGVSEGEANITVTANDSITSTCHITVSALAEVENIAAFLQLDDEAVSNMQFSDAQVLYVYDTDVYVRDASGSVIMRGFPKNLVAGHVLNGKVYVQRAVQDHLPVAVLLPATQNDQVQVTMGDAPQERSLSLSASSFADYADLVVLKNVTLVREKLAGNTKNSVVARDGDALAVLWNQFALKNITVPSDIDGKFFDVIGIFGTHAVSDSLFNAIYLLQSPVESQLTSIASATLQQGRVDMSGQLLRFSSFAAGTQVAVFSVSGRQMAVATTDARGSLQLSMSSWPAGVYMLRTDGAVMKILKK